MVNHGAKVAMIAPESDVGSASWQVEGFATVIEYSREVIEELGIAATEGFNRLTHGGVEIGGVLFGIRTPGSIEICAYRALDCEYALGPSFTLSEKDRRTLEQLLASALTEPALAGMQVLGWYHSHTRSEIFLSEKDLELYRHYFPESWQIALVLRPNRFEPVRAGFFFREADGSIHAKATRREFIIPRRRGKPPAQSQEDASPLADDRRETASVPVSPAPRFVGRQIPPPVIEPLSEEKDVVEKQETGTAFSGLRWVLPLALLALIFAAGSYWIRGSRPDSGLSLRAFDVGGQLRIEWNRDSRAIRNGVTGTLEIEDGSAKKRNQLSVDELRAGSITYMRNTGDVLIRFRLGDGAMETTRFLASPPQDAAVHAVYTDDRRSSETRAAGRSEEGSQSAAAGSSHSIPQPIPLPSTKRQDVGATEVVRLSTAVPSNPRRPFVTPSPAPVHRRSVEVVLPAVPTSTPSTTSVLPELLPHLPPPPEMPKQIYRGPSQGKIIWAGKLARHGVVEILGNHASQGYITGGLPGLPVRLQVFPAEFTPEGLRIFVADAKATGNTEAPGAQNGWNRTSYVFNPAQADRLRIIESPTSQNGWKRVKIRAERGDHSILVLRWELAGTEGAY